MSARDHARDSLGRARNYVLLVQILFNSSSEALQEIILLFWLIDDGRQVLNSKCLTLHAEI